MTTRERLLQVTFIWAGTPKVSELEPLFNNALDWARTNASSWFLWTNTAPEIWANRVKPHMAEADSVLIFEINATTVSENYYGWMDPWFWKWLDKHRKA